MENIRALNAAIEMEPLIRTYLERLEKEYNRLKNSGYSGAEFGKGNIKKEVEALKQEHEILANFIEQITELRMEQGLELGELIPDIQTVKIIDAEVIEHDQSSKGGDDNV